MTGPDLKPCPFCGTTEMLRIVGASDGHGWGFVRCDYCDAEGPDPDNFPGGWNRRTPDPAAEIARLIAERDAALAGARKAHDALWELNPSNYDHDEVCKLNDGAIEAILTLAPLIGETHGYSPEWWNQRAALQPDPEGRQADLAKAWQPIETALEAERDAALAGAVKVKPLVWVGDDFCQSAQTSFGDYVVQDEDDDGWGIWYPNENDCRGPDICERTEEAAKAAAQADYEARIRAAIQPDPEARQADMAKAYGPILDLLPDAVRAAEKAMRKYPQPNYVISKWAEETGEVTKDLIHMAEGRQTADKLRGEIVQSLAMLHRLMVEGDQVHGLPPVGPAIRTMTPPADMAAKIGGE